MIASPSAGPEPPPEYLLDPSILIAVIAAALVGFVVVGARSSRKRQQDLSDRTADQVLAPPPPTRVQRAVDATAQTTSWMDRLRGGLARTRDQMVERVDALFNGRRVIDDQLWHELEALLVTSDVGIRTTTALLERLRRTVDREQLSDPAALRQCLRTEIATILGRGSSPLCGPGKPGAPHVVMVVGVNGAGKTTTIGKLAARYVAAGHKVVIGAGDTFRAAAIEQVVVWGKRAGAEVVRHDQGADPAAVSHDAVQAGVSRGADLVICDTAGRLHTKQDLMAELQKVHRVIGKVVAGAPHEVLLVLDSTSGQNAVAQAREFSAAVGVTGIALTKLDGTARGGVIVGIADELDIPVKLIGIGESVEDLRDFDPESFVAALFDGGPSALGRGGNSASEASRDQERGITVPDLEPR